MKAWLLLATLLAGCGPIEAECETRCGMVGSGLSCREVQALEDIWMAEMTQVKDTRIGSGAACGRLRGWRFYVHADGCWIDRLGRDVCGLTYCGSRSMTVGGPAPVTAHHSSLAHEMVHAVQGCDTQASPPDDYHAGWVGRGIFSALDRILTCEP